jgi:hypothetical protein
MDRRLELTRVSVEAIRAQERARPLFPIDSGRWRCTEGYRMGFYQDQLLPRFQDKVMDRKATRKVRAPSVSGYEVRSSRSGSAPG